MTYRVEFAPEVEDQIAAIYHYIAIEATPAVAASYTEAILAHCEKLTIFPTRGVRRDDVRPGLRITNYKSSADIAFFVESDIVTIVGVFYGGQNYVAMLSEDSDQSAD